MMLGTKSPQRTVINIQSPPHNTGGSRNPATTIPLQHDTSNVYVTHNNGALSSSIGQRHDIAETSLTKPRPFPEPNSSAQNGVNDAGEKGQYSSQGTNGTVTSDLLADDQDTSSPNTRRISRKTGVYVLPNQNSLQEENGQQHVQFEDDIEKEKTSPTKQKRKSPSNVKIVITPEMGEPDSGVDTEGGTPSPHFQSHLSPTHHTLQDVAEEDSSDINEDEDTTNEDNTNKDQQSSRFLSQLHPVYEKKPGVLKPARKISQDASVSPVHKQMQHLTGATRRISQHNRKVSVGTDSNHSGSTNVVPSRRGSVVTIDQIPQIIHDSLQHYLQIPDQVVLESPEELSEEGSPSRPNRVSVFSINSRRRSYQSDVTFWDPQESLPHADHYRFAFDNCDGYRPRPTMYQLREEPESPSRSTVAPGDDLEDDKDVEKGEVQDQKVAEKKGWIQGVLVRCLLNIFGVMLFLRLTWITGQAGIGLASLIVLLAAVVTTLTTMSMAAICTNGEVRGGGAYYMISRSLGAEFGGAIGIIFSLANAIAAAMYVVGFAETLRDLVKENGGVITGHMLHDVRVIGVVTTILLLGVVMIGLDFETKAQLVLLIILIISIINFFVGTFIPPSEDKRRAGFVGYDGDIFMQNIGPDFRHYDGIDYSFFKVFAIFFPAATGILAGANISGDLKNPSTAIPRGTFLAILITTVVYLVIVWVTGSCMLRDAIGNGIAIATNVTLTFDDIQGHCQDDNATCDFGLHNSHGLMGLASGFGPLIYAGIFSATLSSALASLVSAPKVFQALGKDKLFPFIEFFAKGYGKDGEPRRGYFLTFVICIAMTCIGSLDIIAPIISNFFLMAYALINFSCFDAAFANSPGFRPSYHLYNKWCSLAGALVCIVIMFMLSWWAALVTVLVVTALYVYLKHRNPDVNWGSSGQAHAYNDALKSTLKLVGVDEHVKNFRPQILALTGYPRNRPALVDFAASLAKKQSLLVCAHVFQGDMQRHLRHLRSTAAYRWFQNRDVKGFYTSVASPTMRHGTQALLQSQGLGKLRPNTLLMGFKNKWQFVDPRSVHNYVGIIHDAFDLNYGVGILRVAGGMDTHKVADTLLDKTDDDCVDHDSVQDDFSEADEDEDTERKMRKISTIFSEPPTSPVPTFTLEDFKPQYSPGAVNGGFYMDDDDDDKTDEEAEDDATPKKSPTADSSKTKEQDGSKNKMDADGKENVGSEFGPDKPPPLLRSVLSKAESLNDSVDGNYFRTKQKGTIDVWWLFDDGGLGLLLPHILSTRKQWKNCKLRVFCTGTKKSNLEEDQNRMAALLHKFRIDYSEIIVFPDLRKKPRRSSYKEFEELIYRWRLQPGETQDDYPWKVSNADLASHKDKIYLQIKIREKILEHSTKASLIVVTLPVPRKFCPAGLYMAWLDTLTRDLPPTLLLRGNQQSVLTYFS